MRLTRRIVRWALHLLLFGLCLEFAARVDDRISYGAPLWDRYDADLLREADADGLRRNVPGARFEKWQINAVGFRGEAIEREKPAGRRRIGCLGQSESFGLFEGEGGEWPARLAQLFRSKRPDTEVFNASVVGLGRQARQAYIERYVLPLRPDVLVLYFNVLSDASYRWSEPAQPEVDPRPAAASAATTIPLQDRLPASRVVPKLRQRFRAAIPDGIWRRFRAWRVERALRRVELAALSGRRPLDALPPEAVRSFETHLRAVVIAQRERGVAPVLATYPTLGTVENRSQYRVEFLDERVWHVELSELGMIDAAARLNEAVRRVSRELAVPLADVDAAMPKTTEYFADYVHYTDRGAELVAERIMEALERSGLLDEGTPPVAASRSSTDR